MKMNIHIWFNKCQLLIYMSVGKRRPRGANSAGRNGAPNSQLALSPTPLHGQAWAPHHERGRGQPLGKAPHLSGCFCPESLPHQERARERRGARSSLQESHRNYGHPHPSGGPQKSHLNHPHCAYMGLPVCQQTSCHEVSRDTGDSSQKSVGTRRSVVALHSDSWLPRAQPMWPEGLQPLPQGCHSASLPNPLSLPRTLPGCPPW